MSSRQPEPRTGHSDACNFSRIAFALAVLLLGRLAPRLARYQAARFARWEKETPAFYHYRVTPASLGRARGPGRCHPPRHHPTA